MSLGIIAQPPIFTGLYPFCKTCNQLIRKIILWQGEIDSHPGALAEVLDPFVNTGTGLQVVMRCRHPREDSKAIVDVCP
jgi:hypothetical protein